VPALNLLPFGFVFFQYRIFDAAASGTRNHRTSRRRNVGEAWWLLVFTRKKSDLSTSSSQKAGLASGLFVATRVRKLMS